MAEVVISGKKGLLKGLRLNSDNLATIRKMPGKRQWVERDLLFDLSDKNINFLRENFPDIEWSPEADKFLAEADGRKELAVMAMLSKQNGAALKDDGGFIYKTQPFDHQRQAFVLSRDHEYFALFMEMGTGKSKVIVDTAAYMWLNDQIDCLVVLAPNGVHRKWVEKELVDHMPDWVDYDARFWTGSASNRREVDELIRNYDGLAVFTVNIEYLSHKTCKDMLKDIFERRKVLFVIDESSRIKSPGASRTAAALYLSKLTVARRILSGSPITKNVDDLYSQFKFLHPEVIGTKTFAEFKAKFCIIEPMWNKVVGSQNEQELAKLIDPFTYKALKKDCLDLPDKVYVEIPVELTPEQRKHYNELKTQLFTEVDRNVIEANIAIKKLLRLQQVVCGYLPHEEGSKEIVRIPTNRLDAVRQIVEEAPRKVIIWGRFQADIEALHNTFHNEFGVVTYYGRNTAEQNDRNMKEWKKSRDLKLFCGTQAAAGIGLDLVEADCVIYYSNSFDAEHRWQSEDRAHRIGQVNKVTYYDLVAHGTIDRKILRALKAKKDIADMIIANGISDVLETA